MAGGTEAAHTLLGVVSTIVAMIAVMAFLNATFQYFGTLVGLDFLTFEWILGKLFIPLAFIMGVPWSECEKVGQLIAIKCILNEFIAYRRLGQMIATNTISHRSATIATYAMCGSANPGFMGLSLAVFRSVCPEKSGDFSQVILRAFIAGIVACFMTACIAGALLE